MKSQADKKISGPDMLTIPFHYLQTICKYQNSSLDCKYPNVWELLGAGCMASVDCPIWKKRPNPWEIRHKKRKGKA